jgi:hypothetical protein
MKSGKRYLGMTLAQIGILATLALVACIVIGVLGALMLNLVPGTQQAEPTYTFQPSPTFVATSTAWPTITPIPNWKEYSFLENQARIWLPASYSGGDTVTSSEEILENLRVTFNDEAFARDVEGLLAIPEITFFAFDTESTSSARIAYVGSEPLNPDLDLSMDFYLNRMMDNFSEASDRVVERQIVRLDHYQAGKLVVESRVPAGDSESFVTIVIYMVQVGDTMWFITFRTGREEFKDYREIIETSANSFWVQP